MSTVLVTGGTGLLGGRVANAIAAAGYNVRIMSRGTTEPPVAGAVMARADLSTGVGLTQAVAGVTTIVHCATDPRRCDDVDVRGTERLVEAACSAGRPHLVYISIAGIERTPVKYYRAKLAAEGAIARSALPWTVLRTTQFHEFANDLLGRMSRLPLVPVPRGWRLQPIDVDEVARQLVDAAAAPPASRLPDVGGPETFAVAALLREHLRDGRRHRPVVEVPLPGALPAALREGTNLVPNHRAGGRTWQEFLTSRPQHDALKG